MALWSFKKTPQDHSGAASYSYITHLHQLLFQQVASPFDAPIVKNMMAMMNINPVGPAQIMAKPATLSSGYGGLATGQLFTQPLQNQSTGSGGL